MSPHWILTTFLFLAFQPAFSEPSFKWNTPIEMASGAGTKGPWKQNNSNYDYVDDPTVILNSKNEALVAWVNQKQKDVFIQKISNGKKIGNPLNISNTPETFSWLPRLVSDPASSEKIYAVWQEIIFSGGSHGGDILFARSIDGGKSFTKPLNLSHSIGGDGKGQINDWIWHNGSFDLTVTDNGIVLTAWTDYDGKLWIARSTNSGKSFSEPLLLMDKKNQKPIRAPSLATDQNKTVYLAWTTGEDDSADIHLMKSKDEGKTFQDPQVVQKTKSYSDAPQIAVDSDGNLHLAYTESSAGPFDESQIHYIQSKNEGRTFSEPKSLSVLNSTSGESAGFPYLALDADDRVFVAWEIFPNRKRERSRGLALAVSNDHGQSFTSPIVVPESRDPKGGTNGSQQGLLMEKLAVSPQGHSFVLVNSSLKENDSSRIWLIQGEWPSSRKMSFRNSN